MTINLEVYLDHVVEVHIDRPMHSVHPKHQDMIYPINYGYIPDTVSGDGEEIDAYVIGPNGPVETFSGTVIAIIKRTNDDEDKLVVADKKYSKEEVSRYVYFTEQYFDSQIIME